MINLTRLPAPNHLFYLSIRFPTTSDISKSHNGETCLNKKSWKL